jgi:hypothetical protein
MGDTESNKAFFRISLYNNELQSDVSTMSTNSLQLKKVSDRRRPRFSWKNMPGGVGLVLYIWLLE